MPQNIYKLTILKLDHRPFRDKRITTHCALVSRAFEANEFYFSGIEDHKLIKNINNINNNWGGSFNISYTSTPISLIKDYKKKDYLIVHLTMYGLDIREAIPKIKNKGGKKILIIIGGPKVPKIYYEVSDYNISVTNQPHSEVAALSMFLYLINPSSLKPKNYKNSKIKIIPNNDIKKVINLK
jgi:tRNA (cytidine56-2'-O)-methyltransferase